MYNLLMVILPFIAGIAGNLIAAWIQNDIWKNIFGRLRITVTVIAAATALLATILIQNLTFELSKYQEQQSLSNSKNNTTTVNINNGNIINNTSSTYPLPLETSTAQPEAIPTASEYGTELPYAENKLLSIALDKNWVPIEGFLSLAIDRSISIIKLSGNEVISRDIFVVYREFRTRIITVGFASDEPLRLPNRIPIRILSVSPLTSPLTLIGNEYGGGSFVTFMGINMPNNNITAPSEVLWASYLPNKNIGGKLNELTPPEIVHASTSNYTNMPDAFTLSSL